MKNFIPLVLAVILGLAAVLAVGKLLNKTKAAEEEKSNVVAALRDISMGEIITKDSVTSKKVPSSVKPINAVPYISRNLIFEQRAKRAIAAGDYIQMNDVGDIRGAGSMVGDGEWAVTMPAPAGGISNLLRPGDEVAVISTVNVTQSVRSADLSAAPTTVQKIVTTVLFPKLRVLDVSRSEGSTSTGSEITLSLRPDQAQILIAAMRNTALTLALRKQGDDSATNRRDLGMVDDKTFEKFLDGVKTIEIPAGLEKPVPAAP